MSQKILSRFIIAVLLISTTSFVAPEKWYLFKNEECSILFPKKVETTSQLVDSEVGKLTLFITMYDASEDKKDDNLVYGLFTSIYPDSVINSDKKSLLKGFYRGAIDGAVKNVKGELLSEKIININEFEGREIRINYSNGLAIIKMRCFLIHNKMYMLQMIMLTEKEKNASAVKFLDSFKLLP